MNITPEKYIEELKNLRHFIRWTNRNIDTAICCLVKFGIHGWM